MSLSQRRQNAPVNLGSMPVFQLQTPNRTLHRIMPSTTSLDSLGSLDSFDTLNALPGYEAQVEDNPDVITTSIEIDPDCDDTDTEVEVVSSLSDKVPQISARKVKRSGLTKLFSRSTTLMPTQSPGVRLTRPPQMLKTRTKDSRSGFPLTLPSVGDGPAVDIDSMEWMQIISRVNILLSAGQLKDVQSILDSHDQTRDRVSLVKVNHAKHLQCEALEVPDTLPVLHGLQRSLSPSNFLTVPELNPNDEDSDDASSQHSLGRRGSFTSTCSSSTSFKSSISQRLRERFERKDEWCLMFD